ncbi:MAG: phosphotransferase enzyme family protein [Syntrophales bacterium]
MRGGLGTDRRECRDLICPSCPNGCRMTIAVRGEQGAELQGNGCALGLEFARSLPAEGGRFVVAREPSMHSKQKLKEIASSWGICVQAIRPRLIPAGSPERTLFRAVVEDAQGARFILEEIPAPAHCEKMRIIRVLAFLAARGLAGITPYRADTEGGYIHACDGGLWQLVPYIAGVPLDRRRYLHEGWRAGLLARFLIDLKEASRGIPFFSPAEPFSLAQYIRTLLSRIERYAPALMPRVSPVSAFLEREFMDAHDALPVGFCHGDYHPLNIIWGERDIRSVIDWEFAGIKPEVYDLANMVGCLGVEHPSSLVGDLVVTLIAQLKGAGLFADISWHHFGAFVIALRFAWLSEWLRKGDRQMIALELDYFDLLIRNRDRLARAWSL